MHGSGNWTQYHQIVSITPSQLSQQRHHRTERCYFALQNCCSIWINAALQIPRLNQKTLLAAFIPLVLLGHLDYLFFMFYTGRSICHTAIFLARCPLRPHFMALLLMYHHWFPSPAPSLESHDAPGKSLVSLRIADRYQSQPPQGRLRGRVYTRNILNT